LHDAIRSILLDYQELCSTTWSGLDTGPTRSTKTFIRRGIDEDAQSRVRSAL